MSSLEGRRLCKFYRPGSGSEVRALEDVTLRVPAGSFTVLAGPSGSGKTTLLAILGCLERPTRGQVIFDGSDLHGSSDVTLARLRRRIGFVFQDFALIPELPVWENVTYPLIPRGMGRAERYRLAEELLTRLGLHPKLSARPRDLSGGEQQRVAVARALAGRPEVLLADEPTSNLDDEGGQSVIDLLQQAHAAGRTVVLASHEPRLMELATRACRLENGRLVAIEDRPLKI